MIYKISEISTVKDSSLTYVLVDFWANRQSLRGGDPPVLTNDFLMQLQTTSIRIITNEEGWLKATDGTFIDPATLTPDDPQPEWERETVPRDVAAEIKDNISGYWQRAVESQLTGDHTANPTNPFYKKGKIVPQKGSTPPVKRDQSDPKGILAKQDIQDLIGIEIEGVVALLH